MPWTSARRRTHAPGTYDAALKDGVRIGSPTGAAGEGPGRTMVMAAPTAENLRRLGALLTDGTLRVPPPGDLPTGRRRRHLPRSRVSTRRASSRSRFTRTMELGIISLSDLAADPETGRSVAALDRLDDTLANAARRR